MNVVRDSRTYQLVIFSAQNVQELRKVGKYMLSISPRQALRLDRNMQKPIPGLICLE